MTIFRISNVLVSLYSFGISDMTLSIAADSIKVDRGTRLLLSRMSIGEVLGILYVALYFAC